MFIYPLLLKGREWLFRKFFKDKNLIFEEYVNLSLKDSSMLFDFFLENIKNTKKHFYVIKITELYI